MARGLSLEASILFWTVQSSNCYLIKLETKEKEIYYEELTAKRFVGTDKAQTNVCCWKISVVAYSLILSLRFDDVLP